MRGSVQGTFVKQTADNGDPFMAQLEIDERNYNAQDESRNIADLSEIEVEVGTRHNFLKKKPRRWEKGGNKFHYRQSTYDIGVAVSVTDEIINLEPLEDKVNMLRRKYEMSKVDVLMSIRNRLNFFSLYNLFDTVAFNHIDVQKLQ